MTSLLDVVTSESPDVNTSISLNVTMVVPITKRLAGHVSPSAVPLVAIFLILSVLNMCGNGFTLITIRMTPRLWTKTNVIMTSMLLSYFITSFCLICYNSYKLLVDEYNNQCRYTLDVTGFTILIKMPAYVSGLHTILISIERYIAIVYALHYETIFTDCTLKLAISSVWMIGILMGMTFALWLINANLHNCRLIPVHYELLDVALYILVCICLVVCYRKILAISWHQSQRTEPQLANANHASGPSAQAATVATATQRSKATTGDYTEDWNHKPLSGTEAPSRLAGATLSELTQQQQRQKIKSRRGEFKAAYIIAAIVGAWVILSFPRMFGHILLSVGYNPVVTSDIMKVSGAMATLKFASTWAIYTAMSKSYRRAYRQMLIRISCCFCKNVTLPADNSLVV